MWTSAWRRRAQYKYPNMVKLEHNPDYSMHPLVVIFDVAVLFLNQPIVLICLTTAEERFSIFQTSAFPKSFLGFLCGRAKSFGCTCSLVVQSMATSLLQII